MTKTQEEWASYVAQEYVDGTDHDGVEWPLRVGAYIVNALALASTEAAKEQREKDCLEVCGMCEEAGHRFKKAEFFNGSWVHFFTDERLAGDYEPCDATSLRRASAGEAKGDSP